MNAPTANPTEPVPFEQHLFPTQNTDALVAYYLGIFSLIPLLGLVLGPIAIWRGRTGRAKAKTLPGRVGHTHATVGVVAGGFATLLNWGGSLLLWVLIVVSGATH
jgi:hypothetical protein